MISQRLTVSEQLALTATQAVAAIRSKRLGAYAYMKTLLDQSIQLDGLRCLISVDSEGALAAAARTDEMIARGDPLPPLAGLPIVVKDNINTNNLPTTGGTPGLRLSQPKAHAPSVQKLVDAGAIVLGKANLHELAFGATSTNFSDFAGFVQNPYARHCIPGGSSGGTAAAIAARIAPAGLGTDTGGSTRVPAALCGIVGLRPSVGNGGAERRYHDSGAVIPISHTRDTVGPMARSVADVAMLDAVITGSDVISPTKLQGLRMGIPAYFWSHLEADLGAVVTKARDLLISAGVVMIDMDLPELMALNEKVSFPFALHEPVVDLPSYLSAHGLGHITLTQLAAQIASPDVKDAFSAIVGDVYAAAYPEALNTYRPQMQALYASYFAAHRLDAILFPTTPIAAVPMDRHKGSSTVSINGAPPVDEFTTLIRNTDPASNAGIPGLSMFAGMTASGLPVGLEIDGPLGSDRRLLSIGLSIEHLLGAAPPPSFE